MKSAPGGFPATHTKDTHMVNINDAFPSKFLKASEVGKRPRKYIMKYIDQEVVGTDQKLILYFQHEPKGLVLNKTNANAIAHLYGPDTDNWAGQPILLYSTMVDYAGKPTEAIRTMPPMEDEAPPARRPAPQQAPVSRQAVPQRPAPQRRQEFDQVDEFPGDRPPVDAYQDADYEA